MSRKFEKPGEWNHAPRHALQRDRGVIHPMGTLLGAEKPRPGFLRRFFGS